MKEIEILVEVYGEKNEVLEKIKGYEYKGDKKTLDIYYFDPKRDNLKPNSETLRLNECFRLREKQGQCYMTYKDDHFDEDDKWLYSDEYETKVDSLEVAKSIVSRLGLEELVVIDNTKSTYETDKYEIVLEDVKDLGVFLEVEAFIDDDEVDVLEVKREIQKFIDNLGINVSEELNSGKPELMLKKMSK